MWFAIVNILLASALWINTKELLKLTNSRALIVIIIVAAIASVWKYLDLKTPKIELALYNNDRTQNVQLPNSMNLPFSQELIQDVFDPTYLAGLIVKNTSLSSLKNLEIVLTDAFIFENGVFNNLGYMGNLTLKIKEEDKTIRPGLSKSINVFSFHLINHTNGTGRLYLNLEKECLLRPGRYKFVLQSSSDSSITPAKISLELDFNQSNVFMPLNLKIIENETRLSLDNK